MNHGSLFSGIGGFDLAAQWMGWDNVFHVEFNPWCRKVLNFHFPESQSYQDVREFDGTAWRGRVDIISGGFPCQPYSSAGKRLGKDDERHLWPEMLRVIREAAPAYVVGENVRGLTNWNGGVVFEEVCADLEAEGYEVWTGILPAAGVGAPHRRDRVWFVAHAHSRADVRTPGRDAGTSASEGIPERHQVRIPDQSGNVWDAADTEGAGITADLDKRGEQKLHNRAEIRDRIAADGQIGHAADTECQRRGTLPEEVEPKKSDGPGVVCNGRKWDASDTNCRGLERTIEIGRYGVNVERQSEFGHAADTDGNRISRQPVDGRTSKNPGQRWEDFAEDGDLRNFRAWQTFPTQPPVCGGDDGISRELDGITFSKWRNESIKAYGNAIVPQVAFEIFKAIQNTR